jgi:hypothetical protein
MTSSGGAQATSGGAQATSGGAQATSGGAQATSGGTQATSGGTQATSGGTGSGGATTATGGTTVNTGGNTTATGGTTQSTGGNASAGSTAGSGGATGGTTGNTDPPVGNELWIGPAGSDTNPGTKEAPMQNLSEAVKKMCGTSCSGKEGFTIWVKGGSYKPEKLLFISASFNGVAGKLNKVWAEPGEKPVFDCSASECVKDNGSSGQPCFFSHCLRVHGSYWHIKGLEITKAKDGGVLVAGSHNTLEQLYTHHNDDTGLQIDIFDDEFYGMIAGEHPIKEKVPAGGGSNNLILNCDSAFNLDRAKNGENADGFGAKKKKGEGNVIRGCRAWDNSDDGYDFYGWKSQFTLEKSFALNSAKGLSGSGSDGNGFKLGSAGGDGNHKLVSCFATGNKAKGFTRNNGAESSCSGGCGSWGNGAADLGVSGITIKSGPSSSAIIAAKRDAEGNLPDISKM